MNKKVFCEICGAEIPHERLEILPETTTCVKCSEAKPYSESEYLGFNVAKDQERNRLNMEDLEADDTDSYLYYDDEN